MAVLTKNEVASAHWYKPDGSPCHKLPAKSGGERATTIRDAREYQLLPSVTSILSIFAKPQLDKWKMKQVALASLRTTRTEGESDEYLCNRIIESAFEQVEQAADLGTKIHDALDQYFEGHPYPDDLAVYVEPVIRWKQEKKLSFVDRELVVVNMNHGYAGRMDVAVRYGDTGIGVIDFKTRKTKPGEKVESYDGQATQIAAYCAGYWGEDKLPQCYGANVFISSTEPGRMEVCSYSPKELVAEWEAFKHTCALWRHLKKYDPRVAASAVADRKEAVA